jgi:GNAT superfamily N-acetyltransferase
MKSTQIAFKRSRKLPAKGVRALFQRTRWHHWLTEADIAWYLRHALFVASAWAGVRCVGIAVTTGDGRMNAYLDTIVVDKPFRGRGIGSRLTRMVVDHVERLQPYAFGLDVYQRRTERFYAKFGFVRNRGSWLLEHKAIADRLRGILPGARAGRNPLANKVTAGGVA